MDRVMRFLALLAATWLGVFGSIHPLAAQEADATSSGRRDVSDPPPRLAPSIPFEPRELALLVVERGGPGTGERPLEVVRYGRGGSLRRPVTLDLPVEGRSIVLEAWDWLRLTDRALALIDPAEYDRWLHLEPGT